MSVDYDYTDDAIRAWLQEPIHLSDEGQDRVAELVHETTQQRHWWPAFTTRRSHAMLSAPQLIVASVLFALLGGAALLGLVGMPTDEPLLPPAAASPVSSAEPTAAPTADPSPALLEDAAPTYEATGRLIVDLGPDPSLQDIATAADMAQLYAERGRSDRVVRAVLDELGLDESVGGLQSRITTGVAEDTGELVVTVRDGEPVAAQQIALAVGAELRKRVRDELFTDEVRDAEADIVATESLIRTLQNRLNQLQNKANKTAADRTEVLALMGQLSDLRRTKQDLEPSSLSGVRYLLEWTERPTIPRQPTRAQGPDVVEPSPAPLDVSGSAYEATGRLIVDPGSKPSAQHIAVAESLARRYADRASSSRVVRAVLDDLGLEMSVGDLQDRLVTGARDGSAEVVITVRDNEPVAAERIATAIGAELRQRVRDELITSEVREAEADVAATEALIKSVGFRLNLLQDKANKSRADRAEILALTGQLSDLRRTRQDLEPFSRSGVRYLLEWLDRPAIPTLPVEDMPAVPTRPAQDIQPSVPIRDVVVATQLIEQGTTIDSEMVTVRSVPLDATNDTALVDTASAVGSTAAIDIWEAQIITPNMLVAGLRDASALAQETQESAPTPEATLIERGQATPEPELQPEPVIELAGVRGDTPSYYADDCHVEAYDDRKLRNDCVYGDPKGRKSAMLIGDSHAAQWFPALDAYTAEKGWSLEVHTKGACAVIDVPVWERDLRKLLTECVDWRKDVLKRIRKTKPDTVFVGLSRDYELFDGRIIQSRDAQGYWQEQLTELLTTLDRQAGDVVLLGETPFLTYDPVDCLANPDVGKNNPSKCAAPKWQVVNDDYAMLERRAAREAGAELLSINDILCPGVTCPVVASDDSREYVVFRDEQHITASYMEHLTEPIRRMIDSETPDDRS